MEFHQTQNQVAASKKRYRVVNCGRQWGKTELAVWEMIAKAYSKNGARCGYFAPTFGQARDIAWKRLKEATQPLWVKPPNETLLELFVTTKDGGQSEIVLRSWEAIETVRGTQFDLVVLDEVAKMKNFDEGWQAVMVATLLKRRGQALFLSTPYGENHFKKLYDTKGEEWESFTFTTYDNPHLDRSAIDTIKSTMTPDYFSQEYLAQFVRFTGLIYKNFDLVGHVSEFDIDLSRSVEFICGIDFAVRGFTASLITAFKPDGHIYVLDCYKKDSDTAQNHADRIKTMLKDYCSLDKAIFYGDPAGFSKNQQKGEMLWSLADEYIDAGFSLVRANNEVTAGINYVNQLFSKNLVHIHPRCTLLIDEILQYQWKDKPEKQREVIEDPEKVRKINDHLVDCLRYALYSKVQAEEEIDVPTVPRLLPKFELKLEVPEESTDKISTIEFPSIYD